MDQTFDATCKRECCICLRDLHLSAVGCSCSEDKFACLIHAKQLCPCTWTNKILFYRYEISELNVLCQALEGKLSAVYKWAKEDLGLSFQSLASRTSKQTPGNTSCSTPPSQDLKMGDAMPQSVLDAYSKWKQRKSQATSNASEPKQNEVASQAMETRRGSYSSTFSIQPKEKTTLLESTISDKSKAKEKMLRCQSPTTCNSGGTNAAGIRTDVKALAGKSTISKKVKGDPKVSTVSSVTNSRYMSFLQENTLVEVSSDSTSSSSSSESDDT